MTDIRKDFEVWFATQYPDPVPDYATHEARIFKDNQFTAYQAGRAHDVDALIAEILNAVAAENEDDDCAINIQTLVPIIRKHFERNSL